MKDAHISTAATASNAQTTSSEPEQHSQCGQSCTVAPAASRRSWSSRVFVGGGGAWSEPLAVAAVGLTGSPSWLPGEPSSMASSLPSPASRGGQGEVSRSVRKVESSRPSVFRVGWWTWSESGTKGMRKWFDQLRNYKCSLLPL